MSSNLSTQDGADIERTAPIWPKFLWHHRVHQEAAGESLYFWRLGFNPVYDRDTTEAGLKAAARECKIRSFVSYELFGAYDLLIRVWLPQDCTPDRFQTALIGELAPVGLQMCDPFAVKKLLRHWPFMDDGMATLRIPDEHEIEHLRLTDIEVVEASVSDAPRELVDKLEAQDMLRIYCPPDVSLESDPSGVKFAISISGRNNMSEEDFREFEQGITDMLDAATRIEQRSLYSGTGFGHFLIIGRVASKHFHSIHSQIVSQVNAAVIRERYLARAMTHISGQRAFHIADEGLSRVVLGNGPPVTVASAAAERPSLPPGILPPGEVVDERFVIQEHLGGGGFAYVYKAYDRFAKVTRALKIFESNDPEIVYREISALRKVKHPNIVKLQWGERLGNSWYLVNEFIQGRSLDKLGPISDIQALDIIRQVLCGLEALHPNVRIDELKVKRETELLTDEESLELRDLEEVSMIHRDIKPENIMLDNDGVVKIVDFNTATRANDLRLTNTHTPGFHPPDADPNRWEPDIDLYGCGMVLYELVCRQQPDAQRRAGKSTLKDPAELRADLSPGLLALLKRACASTKAQRFCTAVEMRDAVEDELWTARARESGMDVEDIQFGRLMRSRRIERQLDLDQLASLTDLKSTKLSDIELGKHAPSVGDARKIAQALDSPLESFFDS